jgi:hypothetical protein
MAKQPLSERIQAAIKSGSSKGVQALIFEAERAAKDAVAEHDAARERALDPLLSDQDIAAARRAMEDADFTRERMTKAAQVLREKLAEFEAAETDAERQKVYDAALAKRDAAAERLKAEYPDLAHRLGALLAEVVAADREVEAANQSLPQGATRITPVEEAARPAKFNPVGGQTFVPNGSHWPKLVLEVKLPAFTCGRREPIWGRDNSLARNVQFIPEHTDGGAKSGALGPDATPDAKDPAGESGGFLPSASPGPSTSHKEQAA